MSESSLVLKLCLGYGDVWGCYDIKDDEAEAEDDGT